MPGSWMSMRIRSGRHSSASVKPLSALVAGTTVCPTDSRRKVDSSMFVALSSTTRMVDMSDRGLRTGHGAPHLGDEPLAVESSLPHHRGDEAVEPGPVLGTERRGGEDDHGDAR